MIIAIDGPTAFRKRHNLQKVGRTFPFAMPGYWLAISCRRLDREQFDGDPDRETDALRACQFSDDLLDHPALRSESIGSYASKVSVHPSVRTALDKRQRDFANQSGGAVLDGRDIGTVIAPDADAKLFVTASAEARAVRRYEEMISRGEAVNFDDILADILKRDERDQNRATAPLKPAEDADLLDTSDLTIDAAVQQAIALVNAKLSRRRDKDPA